MIRKRIWQLAGALLLALLPLAAAQLAGAGLTGGAPAFSSASLASVIDAHVIASGGGHIAVGNLALDATIGQAVAGTTMTSSYHLRSGFWCSAGADVHPIYLPTILRGS